MMELVMLNQLQPILEKQDVQWPSKSRQCITKMHLALNAIFANMESIMHYMCVYDLKKAFHIAE